MELNQFPNLNFTEGAFYELTTEGKTYFGMLTGMGPMRDPKKLNIIFKLFKL